MKILTTILLLFTFVGFSQTEFVEIQFNTKYYEAVDKWVAFPKSEEGTSYSFGFLYIDADAGFTFDYESDFMITENGLKKLPRAFQESLKSRLAPTTADVAVLTNEQINQLELLTEPKWLKFYKEDDGKPSYLKQIGYHYNHVGASHLALNPLLKAYSMEPHFNGLEFELAYAYNALKQFDEAIIILEKAIQNNPNNFYFYRELGYALKYTGKIEIADNVYQKGISISENDFEKSEMAVNMAQAYFELRNREKFDEWAKLTRKYAEKGSRYAQFIDLFETKWNEN